MKRAAEIASRQRAAVWGAVLTALLGLAFWVAATFDEKVAGANLKPLHYRSFDTLALVRPSISITNVIIVAMDEESHRELSQRPEKLWDRSLHAQLLDTVLARGARAVVFDIAFADPWPDPKVDELFASALQRASGKVILAGSLRHFEELGEIGGSREELQLIERFASVAPWGIVELPKDPDGALRRHPEYPRTQITQTHLAWKAAEVLGVTLADRGRYRWINYYGSPHTIRHVHYYQALQTSALPPDVFSNRIVFVGRSQMVTSRGATQGDEYATPLTRWTGYRHSGVEIQATVLLNLLRGDWLEKLPGLAEAVLFVVCGIVFGFGLALPRPLPALGGAAAGGAVVCAGAFALFASQRIWFPWLVVAGVQIPFALAWSLFSYVQRVSRPRLIPDHTLLRAIGRGAYGEVWLAQDAIGGFRAVKIIHRKRFPTAEPFEREFQGMTNFAPISRSHPGLVHILHVGRNELGGYFYYIMEAADDETSGQRIHPDRYRPKTLAGEIARLGRLPARDCLQLALDLTSALEHLHKHQLLHRDLKPANIIFVNGQPKLADIGLVTTMTADARDATRIGTSGFLAPEGAAMAAADVYALGKTLYQAATGSECARFPEFPEDLATGQDSGAFLRLHEILLTACETDPADRYASAAAMRADLLALQAALDKTATRTA